MFDFKKYPELKDFHSKEKKLINDLYKYEHLADYKGEKFNQLWEKTVKSLEEFNLVYAQKIFDILKEKKPLLNNYIDGKYEKWDEVVKKKETKPITWVIPLVEENGGRYRLPKEYYI